MYRVTCAAQATVEFGDLLSALFHALTSSVLVAHAFSLVDGDAVVCVIVGGGLRANLRERKELDVADIVERARRIRRAA